MKKTERFATLSQTLLLFSRCRHFLFLGSVLAGLGAFLGGCALESYQRAPLDAEKSLADFAARTAGDEKALAFLTRHGAVRSDGQAPWTLHELILLGLYYSPEMEIARAQWDVAQAGEKTAGRWISSPSLTPEGEHHSADSGNSPSPWSWGFMFDIPLEWPGKRAARLEKAQALSEAARLEMANTVWRVRARVRSAFVDYYEAVESAALQKDELENMQAQAALLTQRRELGEASTFEESAARLKFQQAQLGNEETQTAIATALSRLAEALGLPAESLLRMSLDMESMTPLFPGALEAGDVQRAALVNRLDIRRELALYEVAEAALREQVAGQFPDLTISPGFLWDQGDRVWRLSTALLLPFVNMQAGPIAEAKAERALAQARFNALQARTINELSGTRAAYEGAYRALQTAESLYTTLAAYQESVEQQFSADLADRLSLVSARLEALAAKRARLGALVKAQRAFGAMEDATQQPLDGSAQLPRDPVVFYDTLPERDDSHSGGNP